MIRFYADAERETVEAVECELAGWPHPDATGRKQMANTHYDREIDAWLYLLGDAEAGVSLTMSDIERLSAELDARTKQLVDNELEVGRIKRKIEHRFGKSALERRGGA